jgi:hypothetical protein
LPKIKCPYLPIYERTSLLGKVVILAVLEENLINTKPTDFLPYVLNGPIHLFLLGI